MIEVKNLSKKFANHWALKDNSWSLGEGRTLGLLGPNGAGKSTTMKIITGLLCSTQGEVQINGFDIRKQPTKAKSQIGFLPETPPLYDDLKVYDYFDFICGIKSVPSTERSDQIDSVIAKLNLQEVAFKPIRVLSKGFRQRVGLGQVLLGDPPVVILDEPSVGLDPQQVVELRNIIKALKKHHTVILSTHVLSEVEEVCDEVVILDKGQMKFHQSLQDMQSQGKNLEQVFLEVTQ